MDERPEHALLARLRLAGPPLGEIAPGRVRPALPAPLVAALSVDRPTRDRLVIFDPASAPFLRPLVVAADVRPWSPAASGRWIVAVPADRATGFEARHPALAQHFAATSAPEGYAGDEPWWALPPEMAVPQPPPRAIVAGEPPACAWDESTALVGGPAAVVAPADPYWLALLGSRVGSWLLRALGPEAFPVPAAPPPTRAGLEGLALAAARLAAQRDELERAVLRRLLADFGPPGVPPGPRLRRWWELDFDGLHAAVRAELRNDIPERFRPTWAEIHADERATHADASARLADLQSAVDAQVAALYGLSGDEIGLVVAAGP